MKKKNKSNKKEGIVLMIVVLVLLVLTATATYTVYATTAELTGAGATARAFQTEQASQSLTEGTIGWIDSVGPATVYRHTMYNSNITPLDLSGFEPDMAPGQLAARFYQNDIEYVDRGNSTELRIIDESNFNNAVPIRPNGIVDVYDVYMHTGDVAGSRTDGYGHFKHLRATYTIRVRVEPTNFSRTTVDPLVYDRHTSTATSRAILMTGPFNL